MTATGPNEMPPAEWLMWRYDRVQQLEAQIRDVRHRLNRTEFGSAAWQELYRESRRLQDQQRALAPGRPGTPNHLEET